MEVSVETGEGLERKLTIQVPAEAVEAEVNNRINSIKNTVRMDGFRPGKVPLKIIKQKYSGSILQEVAGKLMENSFREAISQENLQPAGEPVIQADELVLGQAIQFTATFEIFPDVALTAISDLSIEKPEAAVEDGDVDNMIETLRKQKLDWEEVDRASESGDKVTIDFVGKVDGEAFDGGSGNDMPVNLGAGQMIPGFEEKLTGVKAGDETTFTVPFPEDYAAKHLAGKDAEFTVTVKKVEASKLPEVDDEFARAFGIESGDVEQLRNEIRGNMDRELKRRLRTLLKENVMNALLEANDIEVPNSMIQEESEALKRQAEAQSPGAKLDADMFKADAERRVKLGVLLSEVAKTSSLNITADDVKERIEDMSKDYDDPAEFVRYYMGNQELLRGIETLVMEDKVVDWITDQAKTSAKASTFDEVMNPGAAKA
jgi:trigger factor